MKQTFAALLSDWLAVKSQRHLFTKQEGADRLRVVRSTFYTWLDGEYVPSILRSPQLARDMGLPVQVVRDAIAFSDLETTNGENQ